MESTVHGLCEEEEEEEKKGANYRCLTELQVAGEVDFLK